MINLYVSTTLVDFEKSSKLPTSRELGKHRSVHMDVPMNKRKSQGLYIIELYNDRSQSVTVGS